MIKFQMALSILWAVSFMAAYEFNLWAVLLIVSVIFLVIVSVWWNNEVEGRYDAIGYDLVHGTSRRKMYIP